MGKRHSKDLDAVIRDFDRIAASGALEPNKVNKIRKLLSDLRHTICVDKPAGTAKVVNAICRELLKF